MAIASQRGEPAVAPHPHDLSAAELLAWRRSMLSLEGGDSGSAADLDWLLDLAGGLSWPSLQALWLHPQRRVQLRCSLAELEELWRRHRLHAEPLQYLVGLCPWRDLELSVAPGVLIPRQETEQLVELALTLAPAAPAGRPLCWADLGTGSGCLAVALARALPQSVGLAVEASPEALRQAGDNLRALLAPGSLREDSWAASPPAIPDAGAASMAAAAAPTCREGAPRLDETAPGLEPAWLLPGVRLRQGSWWQAIQPWWGRLDLVVSNPPYIPTAVLAALEPVVRDHEPALALDGGADGLDAIRRIAAGAEAALAPGGVLLLEHHHDQSEAVLTLLAAAGLEECRAHRDLEGVLRFASGRRRRRVPDTAPDASSGSGGIAS